MNTPLKGDRMFAYTCVLYDWNAAQDEGERQYGNNGRIY